MKSLCLGVALAALAFGPSLPAAALTIFSVAVLGLLLS